MVLIVAAAVCVLGGPTFTCYERLSLPFAPLRCLIRTSASAMHHDTLPNHYLLSFRLCYMAMLLRSLTSSFRSLFSYRISWDMGTGWLLGLAWGMGDKFTGREHYTIVRKLFYAFLAAFSPYRRSYHLII
jgi:hypothetical protein